MIPKKLTAAFSPHRVEALPLALGQMRKHEAILLEEPADVAFSEMLEGKQTIDSYLLESDFEFPRFARRSCELLRELHAEGKKILQVDPFMERLREIHDWFEQGRGPGELREGSPHHRVYCREHDWTGALLDYYRKSTGQDFDALVSAVKRFSRTDAARGRLRDELRAEEIARLIRSYESVYIEAGELHVGLHRELRQRIPPNCLLKPVYLMEPVVRQLGGKRQALGPGDLLTLLYTFRPCYQGTRTDLLAARNLIHVKIILKEEVEEGENLFPHTKDQIESNRLVEGLSYRECQELFQEIRSKVTQEAREIVRRHRSRA